MINLTRYMTTRYERGGRGPEAYDCAGLCLAIYKDLGWSLSDADMYAVTPKSERAGWVALNRHISAWLPVATPTNWDLVAMSKIRGYVTHIGLVLPDLVRFIHTDDELGPAISRLSDPIYAAQISGFYRPQP